MTNCAPSCMTVNTSFTEYLFLCVTKADCCFPPALGTIVGPIKVPRPFRLLLAAPQERCSKCLFGDFWRVHEPLV